MTTKEREQYLEAKGRIDNSSGKQHMTFTAFWAWVQKIKERNEKYEIRKNTLT